MSDAKLTKMQSAEKRRKKRFEEEEKKIHIKIWMMLHKGYFNKIIQ